MLDKLISKFIWQKKKPRIQFRTLLLSKEKGGLGLPNLKYYYWAAQLTAVVAWITNDKESGWVEIEQSTIKGTPLSILPFLNIKLFPKIKIDNEWIKHTLKIWTKIKKMFGGPESISRAMPIVGNIDFLPSVWDSGFKIWADKGLRIINQLFTGKEIKPFSQLQKQFSIPSNDMYRYLQIRHYKSQRKRLSYERTKQNRRILY